MFAPIDSDFWHFHHVTAIIIRLTDEVIC